MPLVTLSDVLQPALRDGHAVAGVVCLGWEDMRAYVAAAEAENCPLILQAGPGCRAHTPLPVLGAMFRHLAEAAVHLALTHTRRRYVITFSAAYHGNSIGTKLLSGLDGSSSDFLEAWGGGVIKAPYPFSERIPAGMTEDQYVDYCLWYVDNSNG